MEIILQAHLRVARPTDHTLEILRFYREGLGFEVIASFEDHEGFDGIMLGHPDAPYHFEFTVEHGHTAGRAPTQDNLLVFYLPDATDWQSYEAARQKLMPNLSLSVPAARYGLRAAA